MTRGRFIFHRPILRISHCTREETGWLSGKTFATQCSRTEQIYKRTIYTKIYSSLCTIYLTILLLK